MVPQVAGRSAGQALGQALHGQQLRQDRLHQAEIQEQVEAAGPAPFDAARPEGERESAGSGFGDVKPEIGRVMSAVWQIVTQGTERQRREAVAVLVETRRRLYGILADGDQPGEES